MVKWSEGYVTVNGARFHYLRAGAGRPLVMNHGHSDASVCWVPTARLWAEKYDVILPDARGHGLSARLVPGVEPDNVADMVGILEALGLKGVALGGHSMGAGTSAGVAAANPERVRVLVLEDPGWALPAAVPNPAFMQRSLQLRDMTLEQRVASERNADHPPWSEEELAAWGVAKGQYDYRYLNLARARAPWAEVAAKLRCPGLVLTADTSLGSIIPWEIAAQIPKVWPQATVVHIPGAGHNIRREQRQAFLRAVRTFLTEQYPPQ